MAPLLRRKLQCFYCGSKSSQNYAAGLRQWRCESCEAVNFLDSNGEITDPPTEQESPPSLRYAQRVQRSASPTLPILDDSDPLFCKTCLQNQQLLAQKLADYFPDPSDPLYDQYEEKYPEYRRNLEARYPQVCASCAPRVRKRIQMTGYAAKTDHLRRLMENTRGTMSTSQDFGLRYFLVRVGATGWWMGLLGQVLFHSLELLKILDEDQEHELTTYLSFFLPRPFIVLFRNSKIAQATSTLGWTTMLLGLCAIWWNPTMLLGPWRRASGLGEFYKLQTILNVTRLLSHYFIFESESVKLDFTIKRALHIIMIVLDTLIAFISYRTATIDRTPKVSFLENFDPLTTLELNLQDQVSLPQTPQDVKMSPPFPINRLGKPQIDEQPAYNPFTPLPGAEEEEDSDAMDLDTPERSFTPKPPLNQWQPSALIENSPFHGRLPAAPISPAQKLRNPPNKPTFRPTPPKQRQAFSHSFRPGNSLGPNGTTENRNSSDDPRNLAMAAPRFFPASEANNETGLESIFSSFFSLKDEPIEIRESRHQEQAKTKTSFLRSRMFLRLVSTFAMSIAFYGWFSVQDYPNSVDLLRLTAFGSAAIVSACRLLDTLSLSRPVWVFSDTLVFGGELALAILMLLGVDSELLTRNAPERSFRAISLWYLGAMFLQEAWEMITTIRTNRLRSSRRSAVEIDSSVHPSIGESRLESEPVHEPVERECKPQPERRSMVRGIAGRDKDAKGNSRRDSEGASTGIAGLSLGNGEPTSRPQGGWQGSRSRRKPAPWEVGSL